MGLGSLALVQAGWTGELEYDGVGYTTITPFTRESVASFLARYVHQVLIATGEALVVTVGADGKITIAGPSAFDLIASGNVATRTGFTGTYTGASTYTGAIAASGIYVPANGLRLPDAMLATSGRGMVGDGSGGVAPVRGSASSTLTAWDSGITLPDEGTYDYWHDGRVFGRLLITGRRRVPMSTIRTVDTVRIECDVQEVT